MNAPRTLDTPRVAAAVLLAVALMGAACPEVQSKRPVPSRILNVNGLIDGFAMDGDRFVYSGFRAPNRGCPTVELGSFGSKAHRRLGAEVLGGGDFCYLESLLIALGGSRAVWGGFEEGGNAAFGSVTTGAPGTKPRNLDGLSQSYHDIDGDFLTGVAGDRQTLVYAIVTVNVVRNYNGCFPAEGPPPKPQTCGFRVTRWKVKRLVRNRAIRIPHTPPAALIAVSGSEIALVPADRSTATCRASDLGYCPGEAPVALRRFEIRSLGGSLLARQSLNAKPTAIALSERLVAVLVRKAGNAHIDRFDRRTGTLIGRTSVPVTTADEIHISDRRIVYRVGKAIKLLDARRGTRTSLAVAKARPIGLAIEGRRVAWGENVHGRGRIMALITPA